MEPSFVSPQLKSDSASSPILQVDFTWAKLQARITQKDKPSEPLYLVDFHTIKSPHLVFKSPADGTTVGSGTLRAISIDADYEVHGRKGTLKALKRFKTMYTHLSHTFSETDSPVAMTWTSSCGFKTWDFICLDEQQMPVAKFSADTWAMKKVGNIELIGPKATSPAARDEIVVIGMTLFNCMVLRSASILSLFGAIFSRPGPIESDTAGKS